MFLALPLNRLIFDKIKPRYSDFTDALAGVTWKRNETSCLNYGHLQGKKSLKRIKRQYYERNYKKVKALFCIYRVQNILMV